MIEKQPLEVSDFSGGITDSVLGAPQNKYARADNLLIERYNDKGKLRIRPGSSLLASVAARPSAARIDYIKYNYFEYKEAGYLLAFTNSSIYYTYDDGTGFIAWQELLGPAGHKLMTQSTDDYPVSISVWQDQVIISCGTSLCIMLYISYVGTLTGITAGLPAPNALINPTTAGTSFSYLYKIIWKYKYTSSGKDFIWRGQSNLKSVKAGAAVGAGAGQINFTALSTLDLSDPNNYDVFSSFLVKEIYRTTHNGQNFYKVAEVASNTTTYADTMTDALLLNQEPMYTEGGIPENGRPPLAAINHVVDNTGYYARCLESDAAYNVTAFAYNRFYQSVPGSPLQVPATFYEDMPDDIQGFSSFRGIKLCLLSSGSVYRVEGNIDETGAGSYEKTEISTRAGCLGWNGVVQTDIGVFWPGFDGFYFSDCYQVLKISEGLEEFYATFTGSEIENRRLQGKYDALQNRVTWTTQKGAAGEPASAVTLHLKFGISGSMPFTTQSGGAYYANTAIEYVGTSMIRGGLGGYVFSHEPSKGSDLLSDPLATPANWKKEAIIYDFLSGAHDFGTTFMRKMVTSISVICKNVTNLSLGVRSVNDQGGTSHALKPIRFRGSVTWGDPTIIWGDPTLVWNRNGVISEKRRFKAPGLRCMYKQVGLTNAKVVILISDFLGLADVAGSTLTRASAWPAYIPGYFVAFEEDGFVTEHLILSVAGTVMTFEGTASAAIQSRWVIRGIPRDEYLFLNSYELEYAIMSRSQKGYWKASSGEPSDG